MKKFILASLFCILGMFVLGGTTLSLENTYKEKFSYEKTTLKSGIVIATADQINLSEISPGDRFDFISIMSLKSIPEINSTVIALNKGDGYSIKHYTPYRSTYKSIKPDKSALRYNCKTQRS